MTEYIHRLYNYISKLFVKEKRRPHTLKKESQYFTPLRPPSRANSNNFKTLLPKKQNSYPKDLDKPTRHPPSTPLVRSRSQTSLLKFGSEDNIPFRSQGFARSRRYGSTQRYNGHPHVYSLPENGVNKQMDFNCAPELGNTTAIQNNSIPGICNKVSKLSFEDPMETGVNSSLDCCDVCDNLLPNKEQSHLRNIQYSQLGPPSRAQSNNFKTLQPKKLNSNLKDLDKPIRLPPSTPLVRSRSQTSLLKFGSEDNIPFSCQGLARNRRYGSTYRNYNGHPRVYSLAENGVNKQMDFNCAPEMRNTATIQNSSIPGFCNKGSKSSFEDAMETGVNSSLDCCDVCDNLLPNKKQSHLRNIQYSQLGFPHKCSHVNSKIPVRNLGRCASRPSIDMIKFPHRQRGRHTLNSQISKSMENNGGGDTVDNVCIRSSDLGNWIAYRTDTTAKFEHVFRTISKRRHTLGNLIDSASHLRWTQLAGINIDKDANLFKQFAGGLVVLTLGEYKFLIKKICAIHDLDYWDVLRKMATFEIEMPHESLLTSQ